jgi:hypothetical protein
MRAQQRLASSAAFAAPARERVEFTITTSSTARNRRHSWT